MDAVLQRRLYLLVFVIISIFVSIAIVKVAGSFEDDLVKVCILCFISALIVGAAIEFVWSRVDDSASYLMSLLTFGLQCLVLYLLMDSLDLDLWAVVATQAGMFLGLGPILVFFFDLDI